MLKLRVITALVLVALLFTALFVLPPVVWAALIAAVVAQGAMEWARLSALSGGRVYGYVLVTLLLMLGLLWADSVFGGVQRDYLHLAVYAMAALLWLVIVPVWFMAAWKVRNTTLLALTGWAVLIPTGLAMLELREAAPAPWVLLSVMGLVWMADIAAYFAGRKFGRRKLAPSISPGKTWEGVAGALLGVSAYVTMLWSTGFITTLSVELMLASWFWVGLAVMGDLFESALKRQAGVKDSGALLPGHGGLLDRIDALTSTLPLAALVLLMQQMF